MDYIFYKIYQYYKKKKDAPVVTGIGFLFVLEVCILFFLVVTFNFSTNQLFSKDHLSKGLFNTIYYGVYLISIIFLVYRYAYKERREKILEKCRQGKDQFKTWQIALLPVLFIALSILVIAIGKK